MTRVRIEDELRVLHGFEHVVGIDAGKHRVVAAMHDEGGLPDGPKRRLTFILAGAPADDRLRLRLADVVAAIRIAIVFAHRGAGDEGPAGALAVFRAREE